MMKRLHEEPPPVRKVRPELPAWIEGVVTRAMQRDPADRYQTVAEMLHDLTTRHAATSWRRLRRRVLIPAVVVLAAGAAIYGGIRYFGSRPQASAAGPVTSLAVLPFQNATGDPQLRLGERRPSELAPAIVAPGEGAQARRRGPCDRDDRDPPGRCR